MRAAKEQQRLLFVTLSNVGDALMTIPTLNVMHSLYPEAIVDIVARERTTEIFTHYPHLGTLITKPRTDRLRDYFPYVRRLRQRRYNFVVDLRSPIVPFFVRADNRAIKRRVDDFSCHAVLDNLSILDRSVRVTSLVPDHDVWLSAHERNKASDLLASLDSEAFIAIGPGANSAHKIWPVEHYYHLITELAAAHPACSFVLFGDRGDQAICQELVGQLEFPVLDLSARTSLLEAAAVLERARLFIGNDSGLGHLASAVRTPTLTVFGPGHPIRYRPFGERARWLVAPDQDLSKLTVDEVRQAALAILKAPAPAQRFPE